MEACLVLLRFALWTFVDVVLFTKFKAMPSTSNRCRLALLRTRFIAPEPVASLSVTPSPVRPSEAAHRPPLAKVLACRLTDTSERQLAFFPLASDLDV